MQVLPDVTQECDKYMFYMPSLPDITPKYETGQKNVRKLSNCDDIKQNNEQGLLQSPTILDQLANLHSDTLCNLAPLPCGEV